MQVNGKEVDFKISRLEDASKFELALQNMQKTEKGIQESAKKGELFSKIAKMTIDMFADFFSEMGMKEILDGCKDLEEAKGAYLEFLKEISNQKKSVLTFTLDDIK